MNIQPFVWRRDLIMLFCAVGLLFMIGLGARPYLAPSEARYIEIPRQMITTGDWLTPRINGVPYFEKPPLFYWMQAATISAFGMKEFSGRLVTWLFATLSCLLAYTAGAAIYGRRTGLLAALVLSTSLLGYSLSRVAMLDVPVSFFIGVCLTAFLSAQQVKKPGAKRNRYWLMYVAAALAVMDKGLIGVVLPGMIIGLWIMFTNRWWILREARLFSGTLIFLLIAAPWHVLMANEHPEFLNFYFVHEHFNRFLSDEHKRTAPWWFFFVITIVGLLPWAGLLPATWKRLSLYNANELFLCLWVIVPLLFFSGSQSKLIPYVFPVFPPLAVLIGATLAPLWGSPRTAKGLQSAIWVLVATLLAGVAVAHRYVTLPGKAGEELRVFETITPVSLLPVTWILILLMYMLLTHRRNAHLISALALLGGTIGITANYVAAPLDPGTIKPLATQLRERLQPEDLVIAYRSYWQDMPVYLNRNVMVANWQGELEFGIENYPQTQEWMVHGTTWREHCAARKHAYVFAHVDRIGELQGKAGCPLHVIGRHGKTVLLEKMNETPHE